MCALFMELLFLKCNDKLLSHLNNYDKEKGSFLFEI